MTEMIHEAVGLPAGVRLGVSPLSWANDVLGDLGADIPLETCLNDAAEQDPALAPPRPAVSRAFEHLRDTFAAACPRNAERSWVR